MSDGSFPAEISSADESLRRLYRYWDEKRGGRRFPSRDDVDPLDFPYALGRVSLIEVRRDPLRFRFRLVSTGLSEHLGYEMTGKFVDDLPEPSMREYTRAFYERALSARAPLHEAGTVLIERYTWRYEELVLPLAADGDTIDMLMVYRRTERPAAVSIGGRPR